MCRVTVDYPNGIESRTAELGCRYLKMFHLLYSKFLQFCLTGGEQVFNLYGVIIKDIEVSWLVGDPACGNSSGAGVTGLT